MKIATPAALFLFAFAAFDGASASTVAQREYKRGYNDCLAGRFDQEQHGASYKKGCRAAEDKRDASQFRGLDDVQVSRPRRGRI